MAIEDKEQVDIETEHAEYIEPGLKDVVDDVLGIEETAASKAAWLISVTVSLGGCVLGPYTRGFGRETY